MKINGFRTLQLDSLTPKPYDKNGGETAVLQELGQTKDIPLNPFDIEAENPKKSPFFLEKRGNQYLGICKASIDTIDGKHVRSSWILKPM